jgi:PAS domain S-box-containing protein
MSISSISREIGINRSKTVKYVEMLDLIGEVTMIPFGKSKLYTLSRRVPYSNLLDVYNDSIVILDEKGRIEMVNKKFLASFNFTHEKDIINRSLLDLQLNVFSAPLIKRNIKMIMNGSLYEKEIQYMEESSGRIYLIKFIPTVSNRGTSSIMIDINDITNQKFREEKYMILDQKLKTIFEGARIGIIFIDTNGNVLNINNASLEMLGIDPTHNVIGMNISKILGSNDWAKMKNNFNIEADIACDFNDPLLNDLRKKTGIAFFEITVAPIKSGIKADLIVEYAILLRDIMDERNAMVDVNIKESRYRSFFENTCYGMFISQLAENGRDLYLKDINKAAEVSLQLNKKDAIGKKIGDLFPDTQNIGIGTILGDLFEKVVLDGIPQYFPPVQYKTGKNNPWFSHYMFKLPSNEVATFIINVTKEP